MSSNFVKRYNAIGWDWYLESYDWSSWVSQPVKDIIESLETENAKLRELCADMAKMLVLACWASVESDEEASQCIYRAEALGIGAEE